MTVAESENTTRNVAMDGDDDYADAAMDASLATCSMDLDEGDHSQLLRVYYARLFPFKRFYRWLSYGNANHFSHREFSMTLTDPNTKAEVYLRFCSYASKQDWKADILKRCPDKLDIGAVYSSKPKMKNTLRPGVFKPVEREFVMDIDMTDYDEVRTCCSGAAICTLCWKWMTLAIMLLDRALEEDFGFQHIMWAYSGRRGVHCWVADERARKLTEEGRKAVVNYLELIKGGEQKARKVHISTPLHPHLAACEEKIAAYFREIVVHDQNLFANDAQAEKLLELLQTTSIKDDIREAWKSATSSKARWDIFEQHVQYGAKKEKRLGGLLLSIMFQYVYPRLDAHVSLGMNHLLKSPFCVHPKTGRICVPIDRSKISQFDPMAVPKLVDLCRELNASKDATDHEWEKTSLVPYIKLMDNFLDGMERERSLLLAKNRSFQETQMEF